MVSQDLASQTVQAVQRSQEVALQGDKWLQARHAEVASFDVLLYRFVRLSIQIRDQLFPSKMHLGLPTFFWPLAN
jgi:hypothetical protein